MHIYSVSITHSIDGKRRTGIVIADTIKQAVEIATDELNDRGWEYITDIKLTRYSFVCDKKKKE